MRRCKNQIIRSLKRGSKTVWELINEQDYELVTFISTLNRLIKQGILKVENDKIVLNKELKIQSRLEARCPVCNGKSIVNVFKKELKEFNRITKTRPLPIEDYDQGFVDNYDLFLRVSFMYQKGDLEENNIFIIGDDDLLSIAIALTGLSKKIVVLEIDKRLTDFIDKISKKHELNIETAVYDVRNDLPKKYSKRFDVYVCDPVETLPGIKLFLSRGVASLRSCGSMYFGLTRREASLKKWRKIQEFLIKMNFAITDIIKDFTVYPEKENDFNRFYEKAQLMKFLPVRTLPNTDWYRSYFIRCELIGNAKNLIKGDKKLTKAFYLDDESLAVPLSPNSF